MKNKLVYDMIYRIREFVKGRVGVGNYNNKSESNALAGMDV